MRPIINLRRFNEFIEHHHFKIENLDSYLPPGFLPLIQKEGDDWPGAGQGESWKKFLI